MAVKDREPDEVRYKDKDDYDSSQKSKGEVVSKWKSRLESAWKVKRAWQLRFQIDRLYQAYEGFQWLFEVEECDRPFVVNLIYSAIETKLPGLLFQNPEFVLRPRPLGDEWDFDTAAKKTPDRQDALNFVCGRDEFGLVDKNELCVLDAFFGFGVLETDYSKNRVTNPSISGESKNPLDNLYSKQIPFDQFIVSAQANWDLSKGKWYGYYEFVSKEQMADEYKGISLEDSKSDATEDDFAAQTYANGKVIVGNPDEIIPPKDHFVVYYIWDFEEMKKITFCHAGTLDADKLLKIESFKDTPIETLRFGKRRKGWYPLPPVWNWLDPQGEINDIRQAQRIHRKRFSRKYGVVDNMMDDDEIDKFTHGPDGTIVKIKQANAITAIADPPLDQANDKSLIVSYDDFHRVSGTGSELAGQSDRETATAAGIKAKRTQIRDSKDQMRVAKFLNGIGRKILKALRKCDGPFWSSSTVGEGLLSELKQTNKRWTKMPPQLFGADDYDIDVNVSSISPIYAQQDKQDFMEFLALITQYEILAFSPALLREAAYRCGYRNSAVLNQFQQLAQLASLGRELQLKGQVAAMNAQMQGVVPGQNGPQPTAPGDLAQNQVSASTPPTSEALMNTIFNRQAVQQ